jgi:predicted membrane-bound spermidine synthase
MAAMSGPWRQRLFFAVALVVFFMSGSAALIYQVIWQRVLTLYYGVGAVSIAIVVAVFMAGLGVGGVLGGWLVERLSRRVALYVVCEVVIAAFGAVSLPMFGRALPVLGELGYAGGFFVIAALLLVPTTLMGMTLPIMVKLVNDAVPDVGRNVSLLYFANTIGAAAGAFAASYWLISFHGLDGAVWFAVAVNAALCVIAGLFLMARPPHAAADPVLATAGDDTLDAWARERWLTFGTGLLAIGYQLVWFRVLSTLLKPNSYVFSTVLSVYLFGLALGSLWMSRHIRSVPARRERLTLFYTLNALIAVVSLVTFAGFYAASRLESFQRVIRWAFDNELHPPFQRIFVIPGGTLAERWASLVTTWDIVWWPMLIVLPCTILMGASFPLVTATAIGRSRRDGLRTGLMAGIAIAGNVVGALVTGFVLLPWLGTERTLLLFICAGLLWVLGVTEWRGRPVSIGARSAAAVLSIAVAVAVMPGATQLYAAMHAAPAGRERIITEDIDGTAVTYRDHRDGREVIQVYIGGSSHATYPSAAYQTEVLEAATYARRLDHVLVIGFGGGDLTDRILKTPGVGRVTVVEISNALVRNIRQIPAYQRLLADPRVTFVVDDGRRFLQRTPDRYDALLMDPLQFISAYSNNLYSLEFFTLVRERLTPEGLAMVWFNEYYVIPKTIATAFTHLQCFYYFCLASEAPMQRNEARRAEVWAGFDADIRDGVKRRLDQPYYNKGGRDEALKAAANYPVNRDLNPVTEYYIGYLVKTLRQRF